MLPWTHHLKPYIRMRLRLLLAVGLLLGGVVAVRSSVSAGAAVPSFTQVTCPHDVLGEIRYLDGSKPNGVICGYLTVPEDRSRPGGRTIQNWVVRVPPPGDAPEPDPVLSLGNADLARNPGFDGGPLAERLNREVIIMNERGVGLSRPNLACPEVQALTLPTAGAPLGTSLMLPRFLVAVQACRDRLTAEGVDLSAYNLAEAAADAEDLRRALGIDRWNVSAGGTMTSIAFEIMRRYPEHIRAVWLDSPAAPQVDLFTEAVLGTRYAIGQIAEACASQPRCDAAYPDVLQAWRQALEGLDEHPSKLTTDEGYGVVVDDATTVRVMRGMMSWQDGGYLPSTPGNVYRLRDTGFAHGGASDPLDIYPEVNLGRDIQPWLSDPVFSHGYAVDHWDEWRLSLGAFYSILCHDEMPFVDRGALMEAAGDDPWYVNAYVRNPYVDACSRWDVGSAADDPHEPLVSDIPTLLLHPHFDPFSPLPLLRQTAKTLSASWIVDLQLGHNVLGNDCAISIRNSWMDDPTSPPDTSCVADMDPIRFGA